MKKVAVEVAVKVAVPWIAAIALILSGSTGFAAALNQAGMQQRGAVAQRQGSDHQRFEHQRFEHHQGFEHRHDGSIRHHELGRFQHFHRHSRVIIIGDPFFWPPSYYEPPLYTEPLYSEHNPAIYFGPGVSYRYYCTDPPGYYPEIQSCPNGWLQVVAAPAPD